LDVYWEGEPTVVAVKFQACRNQTSNELGRGNAVLFLDGAEDFAPFGVDAHADLIAQFRHGAVYMGASIQRKQRV
jgi:hypothetical protein